MVPELLVDVVPRTFPRASRVVVVPFEFVVDLATMLPRESRVIVSAASALANPAGTSIEPNGVTDLIFILEEY